jgi:hypothetical protein
MNCGFIPTRRSRKYPRKADGGANQMTNSRFTYSFIFGILLFEILIKIAALRFRRSQLISLPSRHRVLFFISPLLEIKSLEKSRDADGRGVAALYFRFFVSGGLLALSVWVYRQIGFESLPGLAVNYLALPSAYLFGEFYGSLMQLMYLPTGLILPPHHGAIFSSRGLSDFWGRTWNTWVSDWFRENIFRPLRRRPVAAVAAVFLFSGLGHEAVINFPFFILTGRSLFGGMILYFTLQALGLFAERKWFRESFLWSRVWLWIFVLLPSPLIINEAVLRIVGMWPFRP